MKSKELKDMIDTFFCTSDKESAHPVRVARKTIDGKVYRLFQMHGILAKSMSYGLVEIVETDDNVTGLHMHNISSPEFKTVREKYNKMGSSFIEPY